MILKNTICQNSIVYPISIYENLLIEASLFESFNTESSSGCIFVDAASNITVFETMFSNITNQKAIVGDSYNGAAIFSSPSTKSAFIIKVCFIDCVAQNGHSFGLFGTDKSNFNSSVVMSPRTNGRHPLFFSRFKESNANEINITQSQQETLFNYGKQENRVHFYIFSDSVVCGYYPNLIITGELTSCSNVALKNVSKITEVINAKSCDLIDYLFVDDISMKGSAVLSTTKILINNLQCNNFKDSMKGAAVVYNWTTVESVEMPFARRGEECHMMYGRVGSFSNGNLSPGVTPLPLLLLGYLGFKI